MRICLAQIDTTVGAFEENAAACVRAAATAADGGAQLVVFPELTLPGYPPRDLLGLREFIARGDRTLRDLARETAFSRVAGLVGFAEPHEGAGAGLYNACALLYQGQVLGVGRKSLLPTYDVFDEARHFDPAPQVVLVEVHGLPIGLTICEDLWNDKQFWEKPRYERDPVEELVAKGARAIINLSASPYALGKAEHRRRMVSATARRHGVPIALCNLVGGNDSLLFDGRSCAFGPSGEQLGEARAFEEELLFVELPVAAAAGAAMPMAAAAALVNPPPEPGARAVISAYDSDLSSASCRDLAAALTLGIRDYARKTGFSGAVLGLSGGIDSSLCAVLAARALGPRNVTGIAMPSRYTASMSNEDARALAERLGINFHSAEIEPIFSAYLATLAPLFAGKKADVSEENLQARIRGALLMAFSNKHGALLITTGNKSELGTGFCTLYGDMAGGLAAIGDLPKTAVYAVSRWVNEEASRALIPQRVLTRPPTAELRENQTDQDSLPPYDVLDQVLRGHIEEHLGAGELIARGFPEDLVRRVLKLVVSSEYKRRQAAPVLRVTARAFGEGWRFPIAQRYRY